jgi:acyl transferase domain-containing protein
VKPNIGHLESASGAASLIKAILMLENDAMPPVINLKELKDSCQGEEILVSRMRLCVKKKERKY